MLEGTGPAGAILRVKKSFKTKTFPQADGKPIEFDDTLNSSMEIPADGRFQFHVNQSTRPIVAVDKGRPATGPASPPQSFSGGVAGAAAPCADPESNAPTCVNDHPFDVPAGGVDNAEAVVRIEWATQASDWDLRVFRDTNNNDTVDAGEPEVGTSQQGTTDFEQTTLAAPNLVPGASYSSASTTSPRPSPTTAA